MKKFKKLPTGKLSFESIRTRNYLYSDFGQIDQAFLDILWPARPEFDELLQYLGLKPLPNL